MFTGFFCLYPNQKDREIVMNKSFQMALLTAFTLVSWSAAQQQDVDVFQTESNAIILSNSSDLEGNSLGATIMAVDSSDLGDGAMVFTDFAMDSPFGMGSGSAFSHLNNPSVQKDLQLVDDQLDQIKKINEEFSEKIQEKMKEMRDENGNFRLDNTAGFGDLIKDLKTQQEEEIKNILLPNQQDRLEQVSRQIKMRRMGSERAITQALAKELGITAEQKKKIKAKSKQIKSDLEAKINELKIKAKQDLLSELTKEQRKKLEDLLGDDFVEKAEDRKGRFPGIEQMMKRSNRGDF